MSNPQGGQGGGQSAGGATTQGAQQVGGDVRQMSVGDLLDIAQQNNLDIAPVTELLNNMNLSPNVNVSGTGAAGGEAGGVQAEGGGQASPAS